MKTGHFID